MSFFVRRLRDGFSDSSISCSKRWTFSSSAKSSPRHGRADRQDHRQNGRVTRSSCRQSIRAVRLAFEPWRQATAPCGWLRWRSAGDKYFLGQGKMQKADFLGGAARAADEIGKHAVKTGVAPLQLLMLFGSYEKRARRPGKLWCSGQELGGTHIGEVEMEPEPAAIRRRRLLDIELLRRSILAEAIGKDQARQGLRLRFAGIAGRGDRDG